MPQLGADEAVELVVVVRGMVVVVVEAVLLRPPLAAVAASSSLLLLLPSACGSLLFLLLFGLLVLGPGASGGGSRGGGRGGGGGSSPPSSSSSREGGERVPLRGEDAARPRRYLGHILRERPTQTHRGGGRQTRRGRGWWGRRPHGPRSRFWGGGEGGARTKAETVPGPRLAAPPPPLPAVPLPPPPLPGPFPGPLRAPGGHPPRPPRPPPRPLTPASPQRRGSHSPLIQRPPSAAAAAVTRSQVSCQLLRHFLPWRRGLATAGRPRRGPGWDEGGGGARPPSRCGHGTAPLPGPGRFALQHPLAPAGRPGGLGAPAPGAAVGVAACSGEAGTGVRLRPSGPLGPRVVSWPVSLCLWILWRRYHCPQTSPFVASPALTHTPGNAHISVCALLCLIGPKPTGQRCCPQGHCQRC